MKEGIAIVYTNKYKSLRNSVQLFANELVFMKNGRAIVFPVSDIKNVSIEKKKWLLPLVIGGVLSCFAVVGFFSYVMNSRIVLAAFLLGVFLFYVGWQGSWMIALNLHDTHYYIDIKYPTDTIKAFNEFVNQFVRNFKNGLPRQWWLRQDDIDKQLIKTPVYVRPDMWEPVKWVKIDMELSPAQIHFEVDAQTKKIFPYLVGQISSESIISEE